MHPCGKFICTDLRSHVIQHLEGSKHKLLTGRTKNEGKQSYLTNAGPSSASCQFSMDLCTAFTGANIPFNKLGNPVFRELLMKFVISSLSQFFAPSDINFDSVLILVSDAAGYMNKTRTSKVGAVSKAPRAQNTFFGKILNFLKFFFLSKNVTQCRKM